MKLVMSTAWLVAASTLLSLASATVGRFTTFSAPIRLRKGEVHNRWIAPQYLPKEIRTLFANRTMHVRDVAMDIVAVNEQGEIEPLPLFEVYNHHHALLLGPMNEMKKAYDRMKDMDPLNPGGNRTKSTQHGWRSHGCTMKSHSVEHLFHDGNQSGSGKSKISAFGGASGAEFRKTSQALPAPYTYSIESPESFMVLMHFINVRGVPMGHKLWECPCTSARNINVTNGTIDGRKPLPFKCSKELMLENNTACSLATYEGGYRCCEDGVFLTEEIPAKGAPAMTIRTKFTFEYYEPDSHKAKNAKPVDSVTCCDATAGAGSDGFASIEYDIPKCAAGTAPEDCEHVITSVETFSNKSRHGEKEDPNEMMELVHAWAHQHVGGISLELFRYDTNELLCKSHPQYGRGRSAGDEDGFIVGIPPCVWGPPPLKPPPRFRRSDLVKTVARYNSTVRRHGVMSLWILHAAKADATPAPNFLV